MADRKFLRQKLAAVQEDLQGLRDERAALARDRDEATAAFEATKGYDVESPEFKRAEAAVDAVSACDEKIEAATAAQIGLLKMLGEDVPDPTGAQQRHRAEMNVSEPGGWLGAELAGAQAR